MTEGETDVVASTDALLLDVAEREGDTLGDAEDVAATEALLLAVADTLALADVDAETEGETGLRVREAVTEGVADSEAVRVPDEDGDCTSSGKVEAQHKLS